MEITDIIALVEIVKSDLQELAKERRAAADNEHTWGSRLRRRSFYYAL